jgi:hypothetical protein
VDRQAGHLAGDVPERHIDRADGAQRGHPVAPPEALIEQLTIERIFAHEQRLEVLDQRRRVLISREQRRAQERMALDPGIGGDPHQPQLAAAAKGAGMGIVGGRGSNGSGYIYLAFSTANKEAFNRDETSTVQTFSNDRMTPLFEATVQAVEEAIINAMVAAETMEGINGNTAYALPHNLLIDILKKYNRIK